MAASRVGTVASVLLLLWVGAIVALAQDGNSSCHSLEEYTRRHPNCSMEYYRDPCSGLYCYDGESYYDFTVQKCEDPVTVEVYYDIYTDGFYDYFEYEYNQSETVDNDDDSGLSYYTAIMDRNASHLGFELYTRHDGSGGVEWLFEAVYIPLDPHGCMCSSMETLAEDVNLDISGSTDYNCTANCTEVVCEVWDSSLHAVRMTVYQCDQPPSLMVEIAIGGATHAFKVNHNDTVSLDDLGIQLEVMLWHFNYSMDVQIIANYGLLIHTILPRHKVILDLTECGPPRPFNLTEEPSVPPTEITRPTSVTPTNGSYDTCAALNSISVTDGGVCITNAECNALECEIAEQRLEMAVDSCHEPPGIRLVMYDSTNRPVFNESFYNGSRVVQSSSLPFGLNVTVRQLPGNAISVKVTGVTSFGGFEIPLIPETTIPINRSSCSTAQPPTSTTSPPSTTCAAMESIQYTLSHGVDIFSSPCYFPLQHNCTVLTCPISPNLDLIITLLRCAHPPAIEVTFGSGIVKYFDHVFNHSEVVPLTGLPGINNTALNVTLDELCPSDIGLQMDYVDDGHDYPLIPYTVIPVNTTGCGSSDTGVVCPTSSSSSFTHSISSSSVSHSSPSIVPTSTPVPESPFSSSCDAMEDVRKQLSKAFSDPDPQYSLTCVRKGCNVIDCSASFTELIITLHCSKPAGIEMTANVLSFSDSKFFNESGVFDDVDMNVTVNIYDLVLGFAVNNVSDGATEVSYTLIPLDSCSDSSSASGVSTVVVAVAATVPVVVLLLVVAIVVIIVGVYLGRRRRSRHYSFHRMAMSQVDDDDDA